MTSDIYNAVRNVPALSRRDAEWLADIIIDRVIDALRCDRALPVRTHLEWTLALANLRLALVEQLARVIVDRVDLGEILAQLEVGWEGAA